ncbi:MAG: cytidine deaminase [Bacteroidota bacterium]
MEEKQLNISYQLYKQATELAEDEQNLLEEALNATESAYAPFSKFRVGAAVLLSDGEVVLGNNQENKAFPSGLCAERVALFAIGAQSKGKEVQKMAIRARSEIHDIQEPCMPCGACRQVMLEYEQMGDQDWVILMQGEKGDILRVVGVSKCLLPFHFDTDFS